MSGAVCWIDAEARPGWHNMAVDTAMLDRAEATGLTLIRLYRWSPSCLSFGRHEPARRRYDRRRIDTLGIACVRRPTGGRAVWHARELTYAVAAPTERFGTLRTAYELIHQWFAAALERLGVSATLAPPPSPHTIPGPGAGPCFATAAGGELLVQGRKVLGSAQWRSETTLLQHGSLLLEDDQSLVRSLALGAPPPSDEPPEAPLARVLGRPIPFDVAAGTVAEELMARGFPPPGHRAPNDVSECAALHFERYRSDQWTWER